MGAEISRDAASLDFGTTLSFYFKSDRPATFNTIPFAPSDSATIRKTPERKTRAGERAGGGIYPRLAQSKKKHRQPMPALETARRTPRHKGGVLIDSKLLQNRKRINDLTKVEKPGINSYFDDRTNRSLPSIARAKLQIQTERPTASWQGA